MSRALAMGAVVALVPGIVAPASAQAPDTPSPAAEPVAAPLVSELADAPYATMGMKLERTIFKVDVLALTLRVDRETAAGVERIVAGHDDYDDELETPVAQLAIAPRSAVAEIVFLRAVSLERFMGGVDDDMRKALEAGWLDRDAYATLSDSLPLWFGFLEERRIQDGDRLSYRVRGDTLRTVYWGVDEDEILLDQTDVGRQNVVALLGAYFAPGSSFRKALVRSLWRGWDPLDP